MVAGAERLSPDVREAFALKFQKPIFEGYGATETTPVASVNLPDSLNTDDWRVQTGNKPGHRRHAPAGHQLPHRRPGEPGAPCRRARTA